MPNLRTFIAIELDQGLKDSLSRLEAELRERLSPRSVRWVRADGIHLTLKFLGDTPAEKVQAVQEALSLAAADVGPFSFSVGHLGCFPNPRRPRVVWVGLSEPTGVLARLRNAVEAHVAPLGFPTERRAFEPHLTLGRVQRYASRSEIREIGEVVETATTGPIGEMTATMVSYIKSDLRPGGAVYTTLFEAKLAGG
jgi:2'-5' RNA ligase